MPASNLTPAQRKAEAKRRAEANAKRKTKPSGRTKADTIGGALPRSVPVTPDNRRDPEFSRTRGGVGDTSSPKKPATPSRPRATATTPTAAVSRPASSSSAPAKKPAAAMPKSNATPTKPSPASESYRDGGKGLYQGSKEYRDKVGGSGNPLLNRFRQDMGRDTSTGEKAIPEKSSKAEYNVSKEEGKRRLANAVDYKPATKAEGPSLPKEGKKNNFDAKSELASEKAKRFMDELRKKREGQSSVF